MKMEKIKITLTSSLIGANPTKKQQQSHLV